MPPMAARFGLGLSIICSLLLGVSTAFAQGGTERGITDFDELIRRDEQKQTGGQVGSAVPAAPSTPAAPQAQPLVTDDLARMLQLELGRLGCDPGPPDGIWGPASQRAVASYNRYAKAEYSTAAPTQEMLRDLQDRRTRMCPSEQAPQSQPPPPLPSEPPPKAVSLAGTWIYSSDCPLDSSYNLVLTAIGPDQYKVTSNRETSGWVSGNRVHMEAQVLIAQTVWDGTVDSQITMSGSAAPSLMMGAKCHWRAYKR